MRNNCLHYDLNDYTGCILNKRSDKDHEKLCKDI